MRLFGYEIVDGDLYDELVKNSATVDSYKKTVETLKKDNEGLRNQLRKSQTNVSELLKCLDDANKKLNGTTEELEAQITYTSKLEKDLIAAKAGVKFVSTTKKPKVSATAVLGGGKKPIKSKRTSKKSQAKK